MSEVAVIIPFRDRGIDMRRVANLEVVQAWWYAHGMEAQIVDDGLEGDAQFNRHRAYNRAVSRNPDARVFVFTEADMLIHPDQIKMAVQQAAMVTGLIVPFMEYRYLSDAATNDLRNRYYDWPTEELARWWGKPASDPMSVFRYVRPESVRRGGRSIGAVSVVSADTLDITGGFTEATSGNWYDDNITEEGFAFLTGSPTRWVPGPAVHLYHLPGWTGDHLTQADREATERNRRGLETMREWIRFENHQAVKRLMSYREGDEYR